MTDAIKMAEMQRANIEFERQRHLANWLIKSSAHMAKPSTANNPSSPQKSSQNSSSSISSPLKNGTITQNPLFFMGSGGGGGGGGGNGAGGVGGSNGINVNGGGNAVSNQKTNHNLSTSLSKPSLYNSQNNLPLQIVTTQDGHKPKLRRFNSHDTSANMFSVVDFENARLARRNEIERQKYKMNSLSSGGDCSTGDSKGSKFSNESNPEPLPATIFLERYSLPRVIRLKYDDKFNTLLSSSSNDSSLSDKKSTSDGKTDLNGELFLLYRHQKNRRIYHAFNSKSGINKKKGVKIPQEYQGYFSLVNERNLPTATLYTTIVQLVRERVYKFITIDNMTAYTEQTTDSFPKKSHYVKSTARAGQVFRLLAVFQDGGHDNSGLNAIGSANSLTSQKDTSTSGREKERGRYAQLLGENRQVVYVSLSVKGKFYEIEQSVPQILQRSSSLGKPPVAKKINPDCVHQINNLLTSDTEYPINLKFISGPTGNVNSVPEHLIITRVSTENSLIVCPIEESENRSPLHLRKLDISADMILTKCYLGFENEQRMFANQNVQNLLKFCQINIDNFQRLIEVEHIAANGAATNNTHKHEGNGLKILRPLNFTKFLHRDKMSSAHEKEDSIIFLSKNDLDNLEIQQQQRQLRHEEEHEVDTETLNGSDQQTITEKMKVFQPNSKKKWFKNFKNISNKTNSFSSLEFDVEAKRRSMDRYQDMSKLLQERFGEPVDVDNEQFSSRPSSDLGINPEGRKSLMKKCMSLQDIVDCKPNRSIRNDPLPDTPDLIKIEKAIERIERMKEGDVHEDHDDLERIIDQDSDQENSVNTGNQQSFISEKLYNEFHVKTKNHSKSSSNLQQLLHFSVPQKMTVHEMKKPKEEKSGETESEEVVVVRSPPTTLPLVTSTAALHPVVTQLSLEDDLPYSNVRDSLLVEQSEPEYFPPDQEGEIAPFENIYAEICLDPPPPSHTNNIQVNGSNTTTTTVITTSATVTNASIVPVNPVTTTPTSEKMSAFGSIRISITNDNQFQHISNISLTDNHIHDNIYNTIK